MVGYSNVNAAVIDDKGSIPSYEAHGLASSLGSACGSHKDIQHLDVRTMNNLPVIDRASMELLRASTCNSHTV
jgi:hypothetical protein